MLSAAELSKDGSPVALVVDLEVADTPRLLLLVRWVLQVLAELQQVPAAASEVDSEVGFRTEAVVASEVVFKTVAATVAAAAAEEAEEVLDTKAAAVSNPEVITTATAEDPTITALPVALEITEAAVVALVVVTTAELAHQTVMALAACRWVLQPAVVGMISVVVAAHMMTDLEATVEAAEAMILEEAAAATWSR